MRVSQSPTSSIIKRSMSTVTITRKHLPKPADYKPTHHVNDPPTSFTNPWPSVGTKSRSLTEMVKIRFFNSKNKNHVPVPADRKGLPKIITPNWGHDTSNNNDVGESSMLKATWIGHASFLVEMPRRNTSSTRGIRVLFDPVFSSNMSPFSFGGPKRISPPPCELEDLPDVDVVAISHDHYDHLDVTTIKFLNERGQRRTRYLCGLGVGRHLVGMGVEAEHVVEMDWWDGADVHVDGVGCVEAVCTPSQHFSGRWWNDHGNTLWCSWVLKEGSDGSSEQTGEEGTLNGNNDNNDNETKRLFFAGDTGYRFKPQGATPADHDKLPACPAFKQIGSQHGPFDLALLPIGCYAPRHIMSHVHCAPEDSICIHNDVKSKKSVGMHYGTVRGNISEFYEDAVEPAALWRQECEKASLPWGEEIALCEIGETVVV